ncbi:MAG: glycosyltransferase family 39 protein [Verrucomicrobiota bacterium]
MLVGRETGENQRRAISRFVLLLAVAGILIRGAWLWLPVLDDNSWLRQTQTADGAKSLKERGFWPPYSIASWRGDLEAKLVMELPVYSYLAGGLSAVIGNMDLSGRIVSLAMWIISYFLLMAILRRFLTEQQLRWAAVLYVVAPLSIELGIAFQPEMLVQVCGLGFLLAMLRYFEGGRLSIFLLMFLLGVVGVCIKLPTMFHYYFIFGLLLLRNEGWRAAIRLRYWLFAIGTLASLKLWGTYVDAVNLEAFPEWTASSMLRDFTSEIGGLLQVHNWIKGAAYLTVFVLTPIGLLFVLAGLISLVRSRDWFSFPMLWCIATAVFYVIWGPRTALGHAYYNLPALAPAAMLFGIGVPAVLDFLRQGAWAGIVRALRPEFLVVLAVGIFSAFGAAYLLRQDTLVHRASMWVAENIPENDLVMVKSNHSNYSVIYPHVPAYSYYSGRRVWIWVPAMKEREQERALETSRWLLVTKRQEEVKWYEKMRRLLKRYEQAPEDMSWLTNQAGVERVHDSQLFSVYELKPPHRSVEMTP